MIPARVSNWAVALISLMMSAVMTWLCYRAAGASLGMFLGALGVVTVLIPPLVLAARTWRQRAAVVGAIVGGAAAMWLPYLGQAAYPVTLGEWLACASVLALYAAALAGVTLLIDRVSPPSVAAGVVVILGSLWLTWPIWMAPHLKGESSQGLVAALVAPHPLFAMDATLHRSMGAPWALSPLAYRWTNIGDDVPYQRPASVLWGLILHGLIAGACIGLIVLMDRHQRGEPVAAPAA